jgi:protein-S-isoprenylcysteine O-methyltransferase Ste14
MWRVYLFELVVVIIVSLVWAYIIDAQIKEEKQNEEKHKKDPLDKDDTN